MNPDERKIEQRYKIAVYSLIGVTGILLVVVPILNKAEEVGAMLLNLGTELVGGALIFFVLHFFFFGNEYREIDTNTRNTVISTLKEMGISIRESELNYAVSISNLKKRRPISYSAQHLDELILQYTRHFDQGQRIGVFESTVLSYFIDFMGLLQNPEHLRVITDIMCCSIIDTTINPANPIYFNKIAAPKTGNPALALMVSIQLEKPCVFIDVRGNPLHEDTIDGVVEPGDQLIIVHDVVASGRLIVLCANELIKKGAQVDQIFVLVERTDRKLHNESIPSELLLENGLELHALRCLNDDELALAQKVKPYERTN